MFDGGDAGGAGHTSDNTDDPDDADDPDGAAGPGGPRSHTAALSAAVDGLLSADPDGLGDDELAGAMVELRREQARLAAAVAELTSAFEARQVHAADGSRSATDWIAVRCRLPRPRVAAEVRDARRLRAMPATRAAFRAGDIATAHVRVLCRLAGHPRGGRHFPDGEHTLLDPARTLRFDDWKLLADHWLDAADPDGPEHRRERDQALRRFAVPVGLHGVGHPDGYLAPLATQTVVTALERIERELFEADWAAARAVHGDATTVAHLTRTGAQRRHDALVEMAVRATTAPADGKRPAPLVTVMVDYPTLAGRVCELASSGTVLAPGELAELLGRDETLIERVVFAGANRVRDISTARTFRGVLRRVLDVAHRRCDHDTCFVPAHRCQGDHVLPWSHGGHTSQDNGRLGCGFHNRWWYANAHRRPPPTGPLATGDRPTGDAGPATATRQQPRLRSMGEPDIHCRHGTTTLAIDVHAVEPSGDRRGQVLPRVRTAEVLVVPPDG
jgi:hypothetical protein